MHRLALVTLFAITTLAAAAQPDIADQKLDPKYGVEPWPYELTAGTLRRLYISKYNAAAKEVELRFLEFGVGRGNLTSLLTATNAYADAVAELETDPAKRIARLEQFVGIYRDIEGLNPGSFDAGRMKRQEILSAKTARLNAELRIEREKEALKRSAK